MPTKARIFLAVLGLGLFIPTVVGIQSRGDGDDSEETTKVTALASPGCGDLEYEGEGDPRPDRIGADARRSVARASLQIVEAIRYELERRGWRAGEHRASPSSRATTRSA